MEKLKNNLSNLNTRRFGTVAEIFICKILKANRSKIVSYDLDFSHYIKGKIEVKFSRVVEKHNTTITEENVIQSLIEGENRRLLSSSDLSFCNFLCTIQQIKPTEFDVLFYGLFTNDCVLVFMLRCDNLANVPYYSNKQHRGNEGEGQFPINQRTLGWHMENTLICKYDYETFFNILAS